MSPERALLRQEYAHPLDNNSGIIPFKQPNSLRSLLEDAIKTLNYVLDEQLKAAGVTEATLADGVFSQVKPPELGSGLTLPFHLEPPPVHEIIDTKTGAVQYDENDHTAHVDPIQGKLVQS